jgi:hypothetical protein
MVGSVPEHKAKVFGMALLIVEGRNPDILVKISSVIPRIGDRIVIVMPCQDSKDREKQESIENYPVSLSKNTDEQEQKIFGSVVAKIRNIIMSRVFLPTGRADRRWIGADHAISKNVAITHAFFDFRPGVSLLTRLSERRTYNLVIRVVIGGSCEAEGNQGYRLPVLF